MYIFAQAVAPEAVSAWPFVVLAVSVIFIIFAIVVMRLHAFFALVLAALLTGILGKLGPTQTMDSVAAAFGSTAGSIGLVIAFASIIGMALMESGAADKIVRRFLSVLGEKRAGLAMLASGFFLSIPVFFDTVFFLLIPLARALAIRAGRHYMFFVMAVAGGGALTHSIAPPTPGPLLVSGALGIDLGVTMVAGILAGIIPAIGAYYAAKWLDRKVPVPVREISGASTADINEIMGKREDELPNFWLAICPVVVPAFLIAAASFLDMAGKRMPGVVEAFGGPETFAGVLSVSSFLGNKNWALLFGALIALGIYLRQSKISFIKLGEKLGPPLESAGIIILITSAGGAFGAMIREVGVGAAVEGVAEGRSINLIVLAYVVTAVIRIAQGSATVAMITGSALMATVVGDGSGLAYHPVYLFLAIGFGSMPLSWMNDSGFWVVGKLSGFTERETLKTWTVLLTIISLIGFVQTLLLSWILPFK